MVEHFRIRRAYGDPGGKRVWGYDGDHQVVAVGEDGTEVDMSRAIRAATISLEAGRVERVTLDVLSFRVVDENEGKATE